MESLTCKGCSVLSSCYILSQGIEYFSINCPCRTCLVKVMCTTVCIKYEDFTDVLVMIQKEMENRDSDLKM